MRAMTATTTLAACAGLFALSVAGPAVAAPRPADCTLVVNGKTYIRGGCDFDADKDGSFRISGGDYFAYVNVTGNNRAEASWNADPASTHAQAPLGELTRKGACWVGRGVEICARNLSPEKLAAAQASRPGGEMITPDLPGASSSCVGARDQRWEAGVDLVLRNCKLPADKVFIRADGALTLDQHPGLCIDAQSAPNGGAAKLVLEACDRTAARWQSKAASTDSAAIRSAEGLCWKVDAPKDENAPFPFAMLAAPCDADPAQDAKFIFAKE